MSRVKYRFKSLRKTRGKTPIITSHQLFKMLRSIRIVNSAVNPHENSHNLSKFYAKRRFLRSIRLERRRKKKYLKNFTAF
jgi:hypothetical protein